jgi:hypothetical protein
MLWQRLRNKITSGIADAASLNIERPVIHVNTGQQLLSCVTASGNPVQHYSISTSRYGQGQKEGSLKTPLGIHRIAQKIGEHEPLGRVFRGRVATDEQCFPEDYDGEADVITTRILWLEGLQPGVNQGGDVDSRQRYIYIHGTADEVHIGEPASIGCIRMKNTDVIALFERVEEGDLVVIE